MFFKTFYFIVRVTILKALVFFHMDGCGHCESMKPEWKKLSEMGEYKGVSFVDIESKKDANYRNFQKICSNFQ